ncbi:hypothetical protein PHISCL_06865 [Aspergillus sclerotialis]|uniref:Uncharacterized protein n=1 Tax=Aspergillus sclerotialis TaxID=2070753 RepID=A0A3A2ZCX8_9EURO|nr:hypothetical protein PHISCL_06865 [Aspergillus sclerotialis]
MNAMISEKFAECEELFTNIVSSAKCLELYENNVPHSLWEDELGRFRVWAGNVGAHQRDQESLDYRLRDASHIKDQIIRQLSQLFGVLNDLQIEPAELLLEERSDNGSDVSDDEVLQSGIWSIYNSLVDCINSLNQMSLLARNPTPRDQLVGIKVKDIAPFRVYDRQHASNKYPHADAGIVDRLGSIISNCRAVIKYRQTKYAKLGGAPSYRNTGASPSTVYGRDPTETGAHDTPSESDSSATSNAHILQQEAQKNWDGPNLRCPLCHESNLQGKDAEKHLGRHLEDLALFALPRSDPEALNTGSLGASEDDMPGVDTSHLEEQQTPEDAVMDDLRGRTLVASFFYICVRTTNIHILC